MRKPPLAKPAFMRTEESGLDYNELLAQDYSVLDPTGVKESSKNVDKERVNVFFTWGTEFIKTLFYA